MRTAVLAVAAAIVCSAAATAHQRIAKSATPEAKEATRHYQQGWDAMHAERYSEAVTEFQKTIDFNPDFAEAYYSLGRAHMGTRDFTKAIVAYQKCREVYTTLGGKQFSN